MRLYRLIIAGFLHYFVIVSGKIKDDDLAADPSSGSLVNVNERLKTINSGNSNARANFQTAKRKFRFIGISRRKSSFGVGKLHSAPLLKSPKSRKEGDFILPSKNKISKLHVSKSFPSSNLLQQRFVSFQRQQNQIEVSPSLIEAELPFDFSDDQKTFGNFKKKKKFLDEAIKVTTPSKTEIFKAFKYPDGLQNKPAFCRRCFKFWRSINESASNASLLQYCCTGGSGKREMLKGFIQN